MQTQTFTTSRLSILATNHALLYKLLACACYACIHILSKVLTSTGATPLPFYQVLCIQYSWALILLTPWIWKYRQILAVPKCPTKLVLRALSSFIGLAALYAAFSYMQIAQAFSITFMSPLITLLGACLLLGEQLTMRRRYALTIGFIGAYIVLHPSFGWMLSLHTWHDKLILLLPIVSAISFSATTLLGRQIGQAGEHTINMTLWVMIYLPAFAIIPCLHHWVSPSYPQVLLTLLMGIFAVCAQTAYSKALSLADVSYLLPIGFSKFIFSCTLAFFFLHEQPSTTVIIGSACIFFALLITAESNTKPSAP